MIRRREFLAGIGGLGLGFGLGGVSHFFPLESPRVGPDWNPGVEKFVPSTCTLCPSHCGIQGRLVDGNLVRIDGNPLHPVSQGGLCPKGAAGIQLLYHPGRLTGPVERVGPAGSDEFRPISWDDALQRIAAELSGLNAADRQDEVGWLLGDLSGILGEIPRRLAAAYGTSNLRREDYDDGAAEVISLSQGFRSSPAFDLASSDLVLSFGAGLSEAWWCLPQAARARDVDTARPRWIQLDVRLSRTAARSDEWLAVKPGTYGAMALGIAYILLKEGLYDTDGVGKRIEGIEDWTNERGEIVPGFRSLVLRHGRTERIAERTGVPAESIVRLAKAFGTAQRPVALWDQAVSWREDGLSDALAIHALNILIGSLNRPGGVLVQPSMPGAEAHNATLDDTWDNPTVLTADWAERIASDPSSKLSTLFLYHANPVASHPDPGKVQEALGKIPLVVSFSPFLDETAKSADLVLPDHTYLERWQDAAAPASVPIPVWGVVQPMVEPLHDTRSTGDVLLNLASRLGGATAAALPWSSVEEIVRERGSALATARRGSVFTSAFRRKELREIETRGWWLPHGLSEEDFWKSILDGGGWFDPYYDYHDRSVLSKFPDSKVRIFSAEARERIASGGRRLVAGFLPLEESQDATEQRYPLRLIPYPVMTLASGGTALMPYLLENLGVLVGDAWETWAEIHPETGHALGFAPGQSVRIESEKGSFVAALRFFEGAQPGVLNVPYGLHTVIEGWGSLPGSNPLRAVGRRRDPVSGLPDWYSTRVRAVAV